MKVTPLSTARRSRAIASPSSRGGPQTPGPVMRIAPKPRRPTVGPTPNVSVIGRSTRVVRSGTVAPDLDTTTGCYALFAAPARAAHDTGLWRCFGGAGITRGV